MTSNSNDPFYFTPSTTKSIPIIVSAPHSGREFPNSLAPLFNDHFIKTPEDTDWYLEKLYDFIPSLDISFLCSRYSRYVVDLNRDPEDKSLYTDGRTLTSITPLKSFSKKPLYANNYIPTVQDKKHRISLFHKPYHEKLQTLINELKKEHQHILLFDAHSIKSQIPSIQEEFFPHFVIGNNENHTCSPKITDALLTSLLKNTKNKTIALNIPFKGGYITRNFADPQNGVHTVQLELCQSNYMDEKNYIYDLKKAYALQISLKNVFQDLISTLKELNCPQ